MSATYLLLDLVFLVPVLVASIVVLRRRRRGRPAPLPALGITLVVLLVLTAVFDNVIIGLGIVGYDHSLATGLRLGLAPVEDFAYAIAAVVGLPALWLALDRRRDRSGSGEAR